MLELWYPRKISLDFLPGRRAELELGPVEVGTLAAEEHVPPDVVHVGAVGGEGELEEENREEKAAESVHEENVSLVEVVEVPCICHCSEEDSKAGGQEGRKC